MSVERLEKEVLHFNRVNYLNSRMVMSGHAACRWLHRTKVRGRSREQETSKVSGWDLKILKSGPRR
jgi:hypothetical protein